jgi:hypothetical protein
MARFCGLAAKTMGAALVVVLIGAVAWGQGETTKRNPQLTPEETSRYKNFLNSYPYFKSVTFYSQNRAQCEINLPLLEVDLSKQLKQPVSINAFSSTLIVENNGFILNIRGINGSKTIPLVQGSKGANVIMESLTKRDTKLGALIALFSK